MSFSNKPWVKWLFIVADFELVNYKTPQKQPNTINKPSLPKAVLSGNQTFPHEGKETCYTPTDSVITQCLKHTTTYTCTYVKLWIHRGYIYGRHDSDSRWQRIVSVNV